MTPTPPGDRDADVSEIRIFLLTDSDVLAQEGESSLWRSVVRDPKLQVVAGRTQRSREREQVGIQQLIAGDDGARALTLKS